MFLVLPCFPSHQGPCWFLSPPRIMSPAKTRPGIFWTSLGVGVPCGWAWLLVGGIVQACLEFRGGNAMYWYDIHYLALWGTIISTVSFFNNWKHLMIILFNFNLRILRVRDVEVYCLYFLELKTIWIRDKWITQWAILGPARYALLTRML